MDFNTIEKTGAVIFGKSLLTRKKGCQPIIAESTSNETGIDYESDNDGSHEVYEEEGEDSAAPEGTSLSRDVESGTPASSISQRRYLSPTSLGESEPSRHASHIDIPIMNNHRIVQFLPTYRTLRRRPAIYALNQSGSNDRE